MTPYILIGSTLSIYHVSAPSTTYTLVILAIYYWGASNTNIPTPIISSTIPNTYLLYTLYLYIPYNTTIYHIYYNTTNTHKTMKYLYWVSTLDMHY